MTLTLRALAALLGYPSAELKANIGEVRAAIIRDGALGSCDYAQLEPLLRRFAEDDLLDLQAAYCELFDRSRSLSLHLFEHVHGDGRERGQAMIDLGQQYIADGFYLEGGELPDFLPVFLEYASMHAQDEARALLGEVADILALLAARLEARGSGYAAVMRALEALAACPADRDAVAARVAEDQPDHTPEALDAAYEETPVTFMEPAAPEAPCAKAGAAAASRAASRTGRRECVMGVLLLSFNRRRPRCAGSAPSPVPRARGRSSCLLPSRIRSARPRPRRRTR